MRAYAAIQWEKLGASGQVAVALDEIDEELVRLRKQRRHVFRIYTLFAEEGESVYAVFDKIDEHYHASFDERADEALDRMFIRLGL